MDTSTWPISPALVIIIILVVIAILIAIGLFMRRRRSSGLRSRFGPEYGRVVEATGDKRHGEAELADRAKRVKKFDIRPLSAADRERYLDRWDKLQAHFVDNPSDAVAGADELLGQLMGARGYPMADFDQRAADLSVDHPVVVENYRAAHEIALKHDKGEASTEDLRQALVRYRTLFEELVGEGAPGKARAAS